MMYNVYMWKVSDSPHVFISCIFMTPDGKYDEEKGKMVICESDDKPH